MSTKLYFLSRGQEFVEGPFTRNQLEAMWASGSISATAQICEEGSEIWNPATMLDAPLEKRALATGDPARVEALVYRLLGVFLGALGVHNFVAGEVAWGFVKLGLLGAAIGCMAAGGDVAIAGMVLMGALGLFILLEVIRGPVAQREAGTGLSPSEENAAVEEEKFDGRVLAALIALLAVFSLIAILTASQ